MVEGKEGESYQTSEELKRELLDYLKDADFGTPKYQALGDFLSLSNLEESSGRWQDSLVSGQDSRRKPYLEGQMRITEMMIALLKHKIANCRSTIKGYGPAYTNIAATTDDIYLKLLREDKNNPDRGSYKKWQGEVNDDLWEVYFRKEE